MTIWDEKLSKDQQKALIAELKKMKIDAQTRMHKELHDDVRKMMSGRVSAIEQVIELIEHWNSPNHGKP